MHFVHTVVRYYPYWAFVLSVIFLETGVFFKRRGQLPSVIFCWFMAVLCLVGIGFFFYHRGDLYSDRWVKYLFDN